MINGRAKGHAFERQIAKQCRDFGWPDAVCSRAESKRTDDAGVDICYTPPLLIQAKAVEKFGRHHETLKAMPVNGIRVLFHKRNNKGVTVTMLEEDFWEMFRMYQRAHGHGR